MLNSLKKGLSLTLLASALALGYSCWGHDDHEKEKPRETITDTDNDGMLDQWETTYFGSTDAKPNEDPDQDSYTNLEEFEAKTDPTNPTDHPIPPPREPQPGDLALIELYLKYALPPSTLCYAETDPDQDGLYTRCDKFAEIVNLSDRILSLKGIGLYKDLGKPVYLFPEELELAPHQSIILFYGYDECVNAPLPDLGEKVKVFRSPGYQFLSQNGPQAILMNQKGKILDLLSYEKSPNGRSLIRNPELDPYQPGKTINLVEHIRYSCTKTNSEGKPLAFSPGTCANGNEFPHCQQNCPEETE